MREILGCVRNIGTIGKERVFIRYIDVVFGADREFLGSVARAGENRACALRVNCAEILAEYPSATTHVAVHRNGDAGAYIMPSTLDMQTGVITAPVRAADCTREGVILFEVRVMGASGEIIKSIVYSGRIDSALTASIDAPEAVPDGGTNGQYLRKLGGVALWDDGVLTVCDSVDDFPETGMAGTLYIAADTNRIYRWNGTAYVGNSDSLALGETSSTAYRGDRGKTAYDHSQITGNPHGATASDVGALPDTTSIPTKTSDLTNDSGYITQHQDISGKADKITVTAADNGKFMRVVNGAWAAAVVPDANGVSF